MIITKENIIGQVVAQDYRTASIFKVHNIDFCCNGNRTIMEACDEKQVDMEPILIELNQISEQSDQVTFDYRSWDMDLLADYIEKKHHRYVKKTIPELKAYLKKLVEVHSDRHPELIQIEKLFSDSAVELLAHMKKEEVILFPFVRNMATGSNREAPPFGTVQNPIEVMMHEHDNEGQRFRQIAALTDNYQPPEDACSTYRVAFDMLKQFEEDLHLHIHLENNILFPSAIQTEQSAVHV